MPDFFVRDPVAATFFGSVLLVVAYAASGRNDRTWHKAMQIARIAYVASIAMEGFEAGPDRIDVWIKAAVMSLIPALYVLAVSIMAVTAFSFLHDRLVVRPSLALRRRREETRYSRIREKEAADLERQRVRDQLRWEADAPKREAAAREAAARAKVEAEHRRRREDARASALREYQKYARRLKDRMFERKDFDQYLERYMRDDQPPDVVEARGKALVASFEEMLHDVQPPKKEHSMASLTAWYQREKAQLDALEMDEMVKETALAALAMRFQELMDRHLEGMQP